MKLNKILAIAMLPIMCAFSIEPAIIKNEISDYALTYVRNQNINKDQKIKNIILFIGDGMGPNHILGAEILKGDNLSFSNPNDSKWSFHGYQNTDSLTSEGYTLDTTKSLIKPKLNSTLYDDAESPYGGAGNYLSNTCYTDSAAGGTALATGKKTNNANIGIGPTGEHYENLVEIASKLNKKTGVISTDTLAGATPSSFLVHVDNRHKEEEIMTLAADSSANLIMTELNSNRNATFNNLYNNKGWNVAHSLENLSKDSEKEVYLADYLLADSPDAPSLTDLTMYALDKLDNKEGFFLMVEASEIDKASHDNQAGTAYRELLELDRTVNAAAQWASNREDTLIIVTADHETGGLWFDENTATKDNIIDNTRFLSRNHSRTRVTVDVFGNIDEFLFTYSEELTSQGILDKNMPTECGNYWQNTDIFKLCASYL